MTVGFDITPVISGRTGIARYVTQVREHLPAVGVQPRSYCIGRATFEPFQGARHVRVPRRVVERSWALGGPPRVEWLTGPVDLVHSTTMIVPATKRPLVVTVYDTAPLDYPHLHPKRTVASFGQMMKSLPRVTLVIAVSHAVASDLARHGVDPDRVVVTYLGRSRFPAPHPIDVPRPFLLTVGENHPRKDQATLVRAFAAADLGDVHLVIAGPESEGTPALRSIASELGIENRVHLLGGVDDAVLAWLYGNALAYCFPSVAEGFVTPIVEAMGYGLPIVASDIAPTVELARDIAVLHPIGDVAACAAALERVVGDPTLRAQLSEKGRAAAAQFTWDRTAEGTARAYERALGR
jgi:glycosyltransferase involved in cell wall biosynthesis